MVSNRSKVIVGVIAVASILVFIAGGVMLGIGITKYNDAKTTTSTTSTTSTTLSSTTTSTIPNNGLTDAVTTISIANVTTNPAMMSSTASSTTPSTVTTTSTQTTSVPNNSPSPTLETTTPTSTSTSPPTTTIPSTPTLTTSTTLPPPGCKRDIAILIDNSRMAGNLTFYQKQMKFITDNVISNWVVDPNSTESMAILYNTGQPKVIGRPFQYYNIQTFIADIQDERQTFTYFQSDISFGIWTLKQNLQNRRPNTSMTTILFTYSSGYDDVISAATELTDFDSSLIIIAIGPDANPDILNYLSGTVITSGIDFSNPEILSDQIIRAICLPTASPKPTPMPTTTPTTVITTPAPYSPCQKYIAFIIDASNDLSDGNFAMQKGAVGLALPQSANHYERFAFGYYSSTANIFDFGRFNSDDDFTAAIAGTQQTNNPPNITRALQAADIGLTVNSTIGVATIIFITKPDPFDIASAIPFAQNLQAKGKFTVVALLDANLTLIQQLTSNIVIWSDMGSYNLTTWTPAMEIAFGCLNDSAATSTTSTTTIATTTTMTTTISPEGPYWPCKSDIVVAVDVSSSMDNNTFFTEGLFVVITFVNYNWSHWERVGLMSYASGFHQVWPFGSFNNDSIINNPVLQTTQQPGVNNITQGLSTLLVNFSSGQNSIRNSVFFTSGSDHDDVTSALPIAFEISLNGPLIIIAYGENANVTELQRLNAAKIIQIKADYFTNGYENFTAAREIYDAFRCP